MYPKKYKKRKKARAESIELADELKNERGNHAVSQKALTKIFHTARKARQEDWELGPLAPKRDIGLQAGYKYGSAPLSILQPYEMEKMGEKVKKEGNYPGFREVSPGIVRGNKFEVHDRVVVVNGRHKGKIDTVKKVVPADGYVWLRDLNAVSIRGLYMLSTHSSS